MAKVDFTYLKTGKTKPMEEKFAQVLAQLGKGSYVTRDLVPGHSVSIGPETVFAPKITYTTSEPFDPGSNVIAEPGLDADGQPWNPDIHAASQEKKADGTWKRKAGRIAEPKDAE